MKLYKKIIITMVACATVASLFFPVLSSAVSRGSMDYTKERWPQNGRD